MQRYKDYLLVTDMDGTLINSSQKISKENIEAIAAYVREGGLFAVATGRTEINLLPYIRGLDINCPCILYNGAMIYDLSRKECLRGTFLDKAPLINLLKEVMYEYKTLCLQVFVPGNMFVPSGSESLDPVVISEGQPYEYASLEEISGENWLKIILNAEHEVLRKIEKRLIKSLPPHMITSVFSTSTYLEVLPYGVSKGSALVDLMEMLNVKRDKVIAIGDYCNDMEMIQEAGVGVATGNAHELLRNAAKITTVTNDEHALAHLINEILPKLEDRIA